MNDQKRPSTHEGYEEDTAKRTSSPPAHKTEPHGEGAGSSETPKTLTDPQTGEPTEGRPDTAGV